MLTLCGWDPSRLLLTAKFVPGSFPKVVWTLLVLVLATRLWKCPIRGLSDEHYLLVITNLRVEIRRHYLRLPLVVKK